MASAPGRLIALEGIDGCGKSTQARLLADRLGARLTFEPGDTALGASLRPLVLDPDQATVAPLTEALLMSVSAAEGCWERLQGHQQFSRNAKARGQ